MNKRDTLDRATKRAFRSARRAGSPITWKQARFLGQRWCVLMWPDFLDARKAA